VPRGVARRRRRRTPRTRRLRRTNCCPAAPDAAGCPDAAGARARWALPWTPAWTPADALAAGGRPRVAVLREEGSNGDREMAAALHAAGLEPWDVAGCLPVRRVYVLLLCQVLHELTRAGRGPWRAGRRAEPPLRHARLLRRAASCPPPGSVRRMGQGLHSSHSRMPFSRAG